MKLNELKQQKNEAIDLSPLIGHYGQSFMGNTPAGQDREGKMGKNIFVRNFMQKAISGLASAINSGLVDPNATSAAPTTQQPQAPAAPVTGVGNKPNTMANAPVSKTNTAKPGNPNTAPAAVTQTPAQVRQQKQAAAGQVTQQQMRANPAPTQQAPAQQQPGMTQDGIPQWDPATGKGAKYDGVTGVATPAYQAELDKQKAAGEEQAKARLAATQSAQQATTSPTAPAAPTASTATGANAEQAALDKMKQKNPKLAGMMAQAGMDADGNDKMSPQQTAALKARLKAGAGSTSGQSGFKNYVGGSGERMTGVDKSGAPNYQKIQREGTYSKLDYILESIININEAAGQSISQYIQGLFLEYLRGVKVPMNDPTTVSKFKTLADEVQATYAKDNGKNALTKLADLGWALSHSPEATQQAAAGQQTNPAADQKSMVGVKQINKIIPTLRKRDLLSVKKTIDNTLAGRGGTAAAPQ